MNSSLLKEIQASFPALREGFGKETCRKLADCPYSELNTFHFSLGMWIRNQMLQEKSPLFLSFLDAGIEDLDEMSSCVLSVFYLSLKRVCSR